MRWLLNDGPLWRGGGLLNPKTPVGGFNPAALFVNNEVGVWYDPSDLSTMYQDNLGTVPAAYGAPVGLILDKSKGGPGPELITEPTLLVEGDGQTDRVYRLDGETSENVSIGSLVAGRVYRVDYVALSLNGSASFRLTGGTTTAPAINSASPLRGTRFLFPTVSGACTLIGDGSGTTLVFDHISVRELPGNHASQPTTTARPTLGREPKGGRRNFLTYTEDFTNAVWAKNLGSSVTPNAGVAPDGTMTATRMTFGTDQASRVEQNAVIAGGRFSVWLRSESGAVDVRISNNSASQLTVTATDTWQRFDVVNTGSYPRVQNTTDGGARSVLVWRPQYEVGELTPYQSVTSAYDITEAGVPSVHYLKFDGVDDFLSTGSIDFTSTDEMFVVAGVRKLSDATVGTIAETSVAATSNNGAFLLRGPQSAGAGTYSFYNRGSLHAGGESPSNYASPNSAVLVGLADITTDLAQLRANGLVAYSATSDQGSGNNGNHPLYIGARAGTSLFFNGHLYGLLVRGKLPTTPELTQAETLMTARTGLAA